MIIGVAIPSMIVVLGGLLTFRYIEDIEERQDFEQIADELKDDVLEVRRREKIFLHFKDAEHLDEVHSTLATFQKTVDNISPAVVKEIGEKDIHDLRMSLESYSRIVEDLYNNFSKEAKVGETVRAEGRKLETFEITSIPEYSKSDREVWVTVQLNGQKKRIALRFEGMAFKVDPSSIKYH